jgi:hypothetical protein
MDMVHGPATVLRVYECTHDVCFGGSNPCAVYELGEECHYDPSCICDQSSWPLTSVVASNFATHWAFHICELTLFSSNCLFPERPTAFIHSVKNIEIIDVAHVHMACEFGPDAALARLRPARLRCANSVGPSRELDNYFLRSAIIIDNLV